MDSVEDIEEVVPRWTFAHRELVREVAGHGLVLLELRPDGLDRERIVVGHLDGADLGLLEELLLAGQDILEEVLVHDGLVREVELQATIG